MSKSSRALSLLLAVTVAMTVASSPAFAGKKKGKNNGDVMVGHLYEPVTPIAHRRQALDNLETEVVRPNKTSAAMLDDAKAEEARPVVYPINGVDKLVLHKLFE